MPNKEYPVVSEPPVFTSIVSSFPPLPPPPEIPPKPNPPSIQINHSLPEKPIKFTEKSPQRIRFRFLFIFELIGVCLSGVFAMVFDRDIGLILAIVLTMIGFPLACIDYAIFPRKLREYKQRKQQYIQQLELYKRATKKLEQAIQQANLKYLRQQQDWERTRDELEDNSQRRLEELRRPEIVGKWRLQQIREAFHSLAPSPLGRSVSSDKERKGYAEHSENCDFPDLLKQYFQGRIYESRYLSYSRYSRRKIPDFAYVNQSLNLYIDIEIDEPYTPRQYPNSNKPLKLIHYLGQKSDETRTEEINQLGWFVIRFSERQVICQPKSCCKYIANFIYDLTEDNSALRQFYSCDVPDLQPERRWTKEEAKEKAERSERLRYST